MILDTEKLIKLLNLTTSDNDAEALSAIRMANSILKAKNILWDRVVISTPIQEKPKEPVFTSENYSYEEDDEVVQRRQKMSQMEGFSVMIEELLAECRAGETRDFVLSCKTYLKDRGFLTAKQRFSIKETHERVFG